LRAKPIDEIATEDVLRVRNLSGKRNLRLPRACRAESNASWTRQRRPVTARARIRRDGTVISTSCFPGHRSSGAAIMPLCHMKRCQSLSTRSGSVLASPRSPWSLPS
jgi:hypothetical protein